jgi:hypothetical protein
MSMVVYSTMLFFCIAFPAMGGESLVRQAELLSRRVQTTAVA